MLSKLRRNYAAAGMAGVYAFLRSNVSQSQMVVEGTSARLPFPYFVRVPSSDAHVFEQIFIREEYAFEASHAPRNIVDAGANIGLASLYFASRFPEARILAIEPEESNFSVLTRNVAPYKNIIPIRAALWSHDADVSVVDPELGKWGFMTEADASRSEEGGRELHKVSGITIEHLMDRYDIDRLDLLKMDIEGAEREVFSAASSWIGRVDALIVELHERMKPGCNRSFYNATNGFSREWQQGENIFLARSGSCLAPHGRM